MTVTDENTLAFIFPILSKYPTSKCLSKNFFRGEDRTKVHIPMLDKNLCPKI